jgi:predicted small lipoprotein YifL
MKRVVLLFLVLMLLMDLADDGCIGKATFYLPHPTAKTTVTSCDSHPCSGQGDSGPELTSQHGPGPPRHSENRTVRPHVPPTLQIILCCHLSSSGGIPL